MQNVDMIAFKFFFHVSIIDKNVTFVYFNLLLKRCGSFAIFLLDLLEWIFPAIDATVPRFLILSKNYAVTSLETACSPKMFL